MMHREANRKTPQAAAEVASVATTVVDRALRELQGSEGLVRERWRRLEELRTTLDRADPLTVQKLAAAQQLHALALAQSERAARNVVKQQDNAKADRLRGELQARRKPPSLQTLVEQHGTWDQITAQAWATFDAEMLRWREQLLNIESGVER